MSEQDRRSTPLRIGEDAVNASGEHVIVRSIYPPFSSSESLTWTDTSTYAYELLHDDGSIEDMVFEWDVCREEEWR